MNLYLAAALSVAAAAASPTSDATPPAIVVHIKNFAYDPTPERVHAGATVRFVNDDDEPHTVTATDKSFDSEALDTNGSWTHTFGKAGRYTYFCELHPYMKAVVIVTEGSK